MKVVKINKIEIMVAVIAATLMHGKDKDTPEPGKMGSKARAAQHEKDAKDVAKFRDLLDNIDAVEKIRARVKKNQVWDESTEEGKQAKAAHVLHLFARKLKLRHLKCHRENLGSRLLFEEDMKIGVWRLFVQVRPRFLLAFFSTLLFELVSWVSLQEGKILLTLNFTADEITDHGFCFAPLRCRHLERHNCQEGAVYEPRQCIRLRFPQWSHRPQFVHLGAYSRHCQSFEGLLSPLLQLLQARYRVCGLVQLYCAQK